MDTDVAIQRTDSMDALLDWFADQPCSCATIGRMENDIDWSRETIRNNLKQLIAADHAETMYEPTGEYRLIEDPRDAHD